MFCLEEKKEGLLSQHAPLICELKDKEAESILKLKQFNHLMCFSCLSDNFDKASLLKGKTVEVNDHQYCMQCDGIHFLISVRQGRNLSKSDCRII
jgi:hypothetical protein